MEKKGPYKNFMIQNPFMHLTYVLVNKVLKLYIICKLLHFITEDIEMDLILMELSKNFINFGRIKLSRDQKTCEKISISKYQVQKIHKLCYSPYKCIKYLQN